MATSFTSASFTPSPKNASCCFLLLEHLDEFATLVWYLVADGKLVEDTFARTIAKLDMTAFESSIPARAYSQARDVLITQAVAILSDARREEDENQCFSRVLSVACAYGRVHPCRWRVRHDSSKLRAGPRLCRDQGDVKGPA